VNVGCVEGFKEGTDDGNEVRVGDVLGLKLLVGESVGEAVGFMALRHQIPPQEPHCSLSSPHQPFHDSPLHPPAGAEQYPSDSPLHQFPAHSPVHTNLFT